MKDEVLYIVIPCYNEEEVILETTKRLKEKLSKLIKNKTISNKSRVMYVNDGSKDNTWNLIEEINKKEEYFTGISLSRNRGHQNALLAGLMTAKEYADVIISMDADLQDDINAIDEMLTKYKEGNDIVYGVRNSRKKDSFFIGMKLQNSTDADIITFLQGKSKQTVIKAAIREYIANHPEESEDK